MKVTPENHDLLGVPITAKSHEKKPLHPLLAISRERAYKGGRILPCAVRFRFWRETQGYSLSKIASRLEDRTREFGISGEYLITRLQELEQGRYKPPTWLMLLLSETYGIKFPWFEFWDGAQQ